VTLATTGHPTQRESTRQMNYQTIHHDHITALTSLLIEALSDLGFMPTDDVDGVVTDIVGRATVDYYRDSGWNAVGLNGELFVFVRWDLPEFEAEIMVTNSSGVIGSEAKFQTSLVGLLMFISAAKTAMKTEIKS
jgi:hypothetical protein